MKPELLLIGGGGHCHSCIEAIDSTDQFRIRGIVGLPAEIGQSVLGHEVIGCDDDLPQLIRECPNAIVAIGQIKSALQRIAAYEKLIGLGAKLPTIVASSAVVSRHAKVGCGTIVMHGVIVNAGAIVGDNTIINSRALIEHDGRVGDHCHISTAAVVNGNVSVGDASFVGSGSIVHQGVQVGSKSLIAAGAVVDRDVDDNTLVRSRSRISFARVDP